MEVEEEEVSMDALRSPIEFEAVRRNVMVLVEDEEVHHVVKNFLKAMFFAYERNFMRLQRTADPASSWNSECVNAILHKVLTCALRLGTWQGRDDHNISRAAKRRRHHE